MKTTAWLSIFALLLLSGCATSPMTVAPDQTLPMVQNNESQVVFMRTSHLGGAINASLFEVTDTGTEYIGISAVGTKVAVKTTPGEHLFMVVSEAADFMTAMLEGGKTYYAMVTPRIGAWKARFSLWPFSSKPGAKFQNSGDQFQKWVDDTKLLTQSQKSLDWYQSNKASVEKKKTEYLPVWNQKTPADRELRTLHPQDGL
ncbi:MAG: hypothetical protein GY802_26315 [Gammaproteobacteria bacterium]|nr:hypothetical protein [Gammaproteobacteria bacterium]